ncbi:MAG TPA: hypothetical protein VFU02_20625, partial [Polyangiaceae bacterium]|nr:hypothetical protein [Polyangiaceae bacterium]
MNPRRSAGSVAFVLALAACHPGPADTPAPAAPPRGTARPTAATASEPSPRPSATERDEAKSAIARTLEFMAQLRAL